MTQTRPRVGQAVRTYIKHLRNERQTLTRNGSPTTGTVILGFDSESTDPLDLDATALDVEETLNGLTAIGRDGVLCYGGPLGTAPISVVFIGTKWQHRNAPTITATDTFDDGGVDVAVVEAGGLVDGGTVTFTATHTDGTEVAAVTVTNVGTGVDAADWTPTKAGVYRLKATGTTPVAHTSTDRITVDP